MHWLQTLPQRGLQASSAGRVFVHRAERAKDGQTHQERLNAAVEMSNSGSAWRHRRSGVAAGASLSPSLPLHSMTLSAAASAAAVCAGKTALVTQLVENRFVQKVGCNARGTARSQRLS